MLYVNFHHVKLRREATYGFIRLQLATFLLGVRSSIMLLAIYMLKQQYRAHSEKEGRKEISFGDRTIIA